MGSLYFPQLSTGALAQYPIKKTRLYRTITNVLADGSMFLAQDSGYSRSLWSLSYSGLSASDVQAIEAHFAACNGPLHEFTFIDPTENILLWSSDLSNAAWQTPSLINVRPGAIDPFGGSGAFIITNNGENNQELVQTLNVPSGYTYCFSLYITSSQPTWVTLLRRGSRSAQLVQASAGQTWSRALSTGQLNDPGTQLTVGFSLLAGQQIVVFGPQLEAQPAPSQYRPTAQTSGVHLNSHWAVEQLSIAATGPDLYSTAFTIETAG
jgi:hypothetical protein